jgi:hypothetical protein
MCHLCSHRRTLPGLPQSSRTHLSTPNKRKEGICPFLSPARKTGPHSSVISWRSFMPGGRERGSRMVKKEGWVLCADSESPHCGSSSNHYSLTYRFFLFSPARFLVCCFTLIYASHDQTSSSVPPSTWVLPPYRHNSNVPKEHQQSSSSSSTFATAQVVPTVHFSPNPNSE